MELSNLIDDQAEEIERVLRNETKGSLRRGKGGIHHGRKDGGVAPKHKFRQRNHESHDKECYPNVIQNHMRCKITLFISDDKGKGKIMQNRSCETLLIPFG